MHSTNYLDELADGYYLGICNGNHVQIETEKFSLGLDADFGFRCIDPVQVVVVVKNHVTDIFELQGKLPAPNKIPVCVLKYGERVILSSSEDYGLNGFFDTVATSKDGRTIVETNGVLRFLDDLWELDSCSVTIPSSGEFSMEMDF